MIYRGTLCAYFPLLADTTWTEPTPQTLSTDRSWKFNLIQGYRPRLVGGVYTVFFLGSWWSDVTDGPRYDLLLCLLKIAASKSGVRSITLWRPREHRHVKVILLEALLKYIGNCQSSSRLFGRDWQNIIGMAGLRSLGYTFLSVSRPPHRISLTCSWKKSII